MQSLQDRINERKARFIERTIVRLNELQTQLESACKPDMEELIFACRSFFHKIAGGAGIYELTDFAQVAIRAESFAESLTNSAIQEDDALSNLRALCIQLRQTLE